MPPVKRLESQITPTTKAATTIGKKMLSTAVPQFCAGDLIISIQDFKQEAIKATATIISGAYFAVWQRHCVRVAGFNFK